MNINTGKLIALVLAITFTAEIFSSCATGAGSTITISEGSDSYIIIAPGYTAVVDKPYGNLIALYNSEGCRMLGNDDGMIMGACAYWNDSLGGNHLQMCPPL